MYDLVVDWQLKGNCMDAKIDASAGGPRTRDRHPGNGRTNGQTNGQTSGKSKGAMNSESGLSLSLLESAVAEVGQLTATLTATQRQADVARQRAEETTSRLKGKLVRLTKLVEHVRKFAYHDELTGLPNRALLLDRLRQAMVMALRDKKMVALLLIDLNGFKHVNDAYGHATGDNLLQHVAGLLSSCIRGSDTACRYGGDEFVIMLPEIEGIVCVDAVIKKIYARLAGSYFLFEGTVIQVTASIGVAIYPGDGLDCDALIKHADILMYQEKVRSNQLEAASHMEMRV